MACHDGRLPRRRAALAAEDTTGEEAERVADVRVLSARVCQSDARTQRVDRLVIVPNKFEGPPHPTTRLAKNKSRPPCACRIVLVSTLILGRAAWAAERLRRTGLTNDDPDALEDTPT